MMNIENEYSVNYTFEKIQYTSSGSKFDPQFKTTINVLMFTWMKIHNDRGLNTFTRQE